MTSVVAINSSPRMNEGNTALILNPFLDGVREAGAQVELVYSRKLNIQPCTGDFACWGWGGTHGKCHIKDDMEGLLNKLREAEIWVYAIPVYVPMPGEMQNILNRLMPLFDGSVVTRGNRMFPHRRPEVKLKKIALVASSGYWERENFDALLYTIQKACDSMSTEFAGALLRPHADVLAGIIKSEGKADFIFDAAREAGRQLVKSEKMSPQTLKVIETPLLSFNELVHQISKSE